MADAISLEVLKKRIKYLYEKHPNIHLNINLTHPTFHLENVSVTIRGVYPNIFVVSEANKGREGQHTLSYTDVWIGQIEVVELNKFKLIR